MYKLYEYQQHATQFIKKNKNVLLYMCRGSGKTLTVIDFLRDTPERPILIITPKSVKDQFRKEFDKFAPGEFKVKVLESKSKIEPGYDVYIINPDILARKRRKLLAIKPAIVVADESHYFKNHKATRTKELIEVSCTSDTKYRIAMTGSAITKAPIDLFGQLSFLLPHKFGRRSKRFPNRIMSWYDFARRYSGGHINYFGHFEAKKATNVEELRARCKNIIYRVTQEQALAEIPDFQEIDWVFNLPAEIQKEYDSINNEFENWLREQGNSEYEVYKKMSSEALVKLNELRKVTSQAKVKFIDKFIYEVCPDSNKAIIFCHYKSTAQSFGDMYGGQRAVYITGDTKTSQRKEAIERFNTEPAVKYMIINIQAGGTGLNLQVADTIIFADLPFNYSDYDQCVGRAHRHGQDKVVNVYKIMASNTVDEKINGYTLKKKEFDELL
jgi:SWI/SNF-related matrix-associated actin-dependent regulator 1 of chromatin subfamily A